MTLLELLQSGRVEEFNAQRGQRRRVELFAAELAEASLAGVDLSGATVEKADLTSADLTDANLAKTDLSGIDGTELKLCDATAVGAKLRDAYLDQADLSGCDLSHADLAEAVLTNTRGDHLRMIGARLRETDATGASWPGADLSEARLHKTNLTKANLEKADLTEAVCNEAILVDAKLDGVVGLRCKLQQAVLHRCSLVGAKLEEANLEKADLTGANLENADLRRANLSGAILKDAILRGANLSDAVLDGVDLSGLDLHGVDLTGVDPRTVGLTEDQLGTVVAVGAAATSSEAPIRIVDASIARKGGTVAVLWENADSDDAISLRWAMRGAASAEGVLPVSAEGVLARAVAAVDEGFLLLVLQERPGGVVLLRYALSDDGVLGAPKTDGLGYEPGVAPIVRVEDGAVHMWGLAKRGPTVVVQKLGPEGLEVVHTTKVPTARGFVGRHHAVLFNKAGVLTGFSAKGPGALIGSPPGFPGRLQTAVPYGNGLLAVWLEEMRSDDEPGGLRFAILAPGVTPRVEVLTTSAEVSALDAMSAGDGVWVTWTDAGGDVPGAAWCARLPDGEPVRVDAAGDEVEDVRFADQPTGAGGVPVIAATGFDEALMIVDVDGHPVDRLGD